MCQASCGIGSSPDRSTLWKKPPAIRIQLSRSMEGNSVVLGLGDPCVSLPAEDPVYALEAMDVSDTHMRHCQHGRFSIRSANICYWGQRHSRGPPPDTSVPSAGINGRCTQDCKGSPNPSWIRQLPHHPFSSQAKLDSTEGQWGGRTL